MHIDCDKKRNDFETVLSGTFSVHLSGFSIYGYKFALFMNKFNYISTGAKARFSDEYVPRNIITNRRCNQSCLFKKLNILPIRDVRNM